MSTETSTSTSTPESPPTSRSEMNESPSGIGKSASGLGTVTVVSPENAGAAAYAAGAAASARTRKSAGGVRGARIARKHPACLVGERCRPFPFVARALTFEMSVPHPILVVEDDDDVRDAMVQVLEAEGYDAIPASDGEDALGRLEAGLAPCLILLDLMMPRMDGWQFIE